MIVGEPETKLLVRDHSVLKRQTTKNRDGKAAARERARNLIKEDLREHRKARAEAETAAFFFCDFCTSCRRQFVSSDGLS